MRRLLLVLAVILFFDAQSNRQALVQLGFKAICQVIAEANLPTKLAESGKCFADDGTSRLTLLAWIPAFSGMGAVAFAAAFAYANTRDLPPGLDEAEAMAWMAVSR